MDDEHTLRREIAALENWNMQDRNTRQITFDVDERSEITQRILARMAELKVLNERLDRLLKSK
ncbi:MAG: hypothetical protein WAK63_11100 [Xanthobacteraceae bacterium]